MVQNICTYKVLAGEKRIILEKPLVLSRIFFRIARIEVPTSWHEIRISFGDPQFLSYYMLSVFENSFTAAGADIFQGDVWVQNASVVDLSITTTEILH